MDDFMHPRRNPLFKVDVPLVTYGIVGVTVLIYIEQFLTEVVFGSDVPALLGMKVNEWIIEGQYWRLFTPMLLHGSILHIGFNMFVLVRRGADMERIMGHGRFALLYVLAGFSGNVFSFIFTPNPSLGASTAVFGVLAAEAVFIYLNRDMLMDSRAYLQEILTLLGINLLIGLSPGIDNWGHLGGLLGGLMFMLFASPRLELTASQRWPQDTRSATEVIIGAVLVFILFAVVAFMGMGTISLP